MDVSRPAVDFVKGDGPRFTDETADLLRRRLTAVAIVLALALFAAFVGNLVGKQSPLIGLRAVIVIVIIASVFVLRSRFVLTLRQLQLLELVIFGATGCQLLLMMTALMTRYADDGDSGSVVATEFQFLSAWSLIILTYGIFMPNTWKRSAAVLVPGACLPYAWIFLLRWNNEAVASAMNESPVFSPVPIPVVAALIASYGAYIVNHARREAFKARQFGQYHLQAKLGAGGMGEVYEAEHRMLKRPCAIKLIKSDSEADSQAIERFEREVRSTAKLSHWNTVEIFDYGRTDDGTFYYVMELLPGLSLEELVSRYGPMPAERAVHFLLQTCSALREAHAIGLIHRDIKPANIFAASRGGVYDVTKLLDFGLVRQSSRAKSSDATGQRTTSFSGSPLYMAPEQAVAYDEADARSDIYAVGCVAYFLLTGEPPFARATALDVLRAHAEDQPSPLSQVNSDVPADLEQVVIRCLSKSADQRYHDVDSLQRALAECQCAGKWTEQDAADWWSTKDSPVGARATSSDRSATPGKPRTEVNIDRTIEVDRSADSLDG